MALFLDVVQGPTGTAAAVANRTALPDLTLPASARMITRIWVTGSPYNFNVAEPWCGYVIVESNDCLIAPMNVPLEVIPGFVTVGGGVQREAHKWIVNCPCPGNTKLSFYVVLDVAQTAAGEVQVNVEFSNGDSPFGAAQMHMTSAEPPVALGTADNAAISLTAIEVKASRLIAIWGYAIQLQPTADESCQSTVAITSSDFGESGPFNFSFNSHPGIITNGASGGLDLTVIETDRTFKSPAQKQTLNCVVTTRDAMAGNGRGQWGVVWS